MDAFITGIAIRIGQYFWHRKLLMAASVILLVELFLRYVLPRSRAYSLWTRAFQAVGKVWTVVLLSIIYLLSVGPIAVVMRLLGKDMLDKRIETAPSFWRHHEPGPLPPAAAARHQF